MEPLSPKHAATIAKKVYEVRVFDSLHDIPELAVDNPFDVKSAVGFRGVSGLAYKEGSEFGYVAKGSGFRSNEALIAIRGTATVAD